MLFSKIKLESLLFCRLASTQLVFTVIYLVDGIIDRYKALLVAKRFTQVRGKDFGATFAPIAKLATVRLLVSLAASNS